MDENKLKRSAPQKKGGRLNVLDIIIILFLVFTAAIAILLTVRSVEDAATSGQKVKISYTVVIEDIDDAIYKNVFENANRSDNTYSVEIGQTVIDGNTGATVGYVAKLPESVPYYEFVLDTDSAGESVAVKKQYSDRHNVIITVTADAYYSEGTGYTVDGCRIAVGREFALRIAGFSKSGVCDTLNVIADN